MSSIQEYDDHIQSVLKEIYEYTSDLGKLANDEVDKFSKTNNHLRLASFLAVAFTIIDCSWPALTNLMPILTKVDSFVDFITTYTSLILAIIILNISLKKAESNFHEKHLGLVTAREQIMRTWSDFHLEWCGLKEKISKKPDDLDGKLELLSKYSDRLHEAKEKSVLTAQKANFKGEIDVPKA